MLRRNMKSPKITRLTEGLQAFLERRVTIYTQSAQKQTDLENGKPGSSLNMLTSSCFILHDAMYSLGWWTLGHF